MKFSKKIIIIFTMLLSFCLVMSFKTVTNAVSFSIEESTYRGAVIKVSSSKKMVKIRIYQLDGNGNWIKFFEDKNVNSTEKTYFISKYRLSTSNSSKIKVIAIAEDGTEESTEKDIDKLPEAPEPSTTPTTSPTIRPTPTPTPTTKPTTTPTPTTTTTSTPTPTPTPTPEPDKKVVKVTIPKTLTLYVDETKKLKLEITPKDAKTTLNWITSNAKVATVDRNGNVTGVKSGTATITVKTSNGKTAKCIVTVKKKKVTLNGHKVSLQDGNDRVYFLDVTDEKSGKIQAADAIILESNGKYAMIDVGVREKDQKNRIAKYLKDIGVQELEWILITHTHSDHYAGLSKVLDTVTVKNVYVKDISKGKSGRKNSYKTNIVNVIKNNARNKNITKICDVKDSRYRNLTVGEIKIKLYNAATDNLQKKDSSNGENVNSVTALATVNGKKIYFAADIVNDKKIKVNAENAAAKKVGKVDFYKVAHHSYSPNNDNEALKYLKPKECVVTNTIPSKKASTKGAHDRVLKYVSKFNYTASGTVILTIAEDGELLYNKLGEDK